MLDQGHSYIFSYTSSLELCQSCWTHLTQSHQSVRITSTINTSGVYACTRYKRACDREHSSHSPTPCIAPPLTKNHKSMKSSVFVVQSRESSQPCPLVHGHTLTMGSTTLNLHIHSGWETCTWCDPSRGPFQDIHLGDVTDVENPEELDLQRRKELNRIKKKYGLRV